MSFRENIAQIGGKMAQKVSDMHASYKKSQMRSLEKNIANWEQEKSKLQAKILLIEGKIKPLDVKISQAQISLDKLESYYSE